MGAVQTEKDSAGLSPSRKSRLAKKGKTDAFDNNRVEQMLIHLKNNEYFISLPEVDMFLDHMTRIFELKMQQCEK